MALVLADRVQEYSTTTGTGTLTLSGAYAGFQTFAAGIGNGNTCYYTITSDTNQWEVGIGTVGVGTLARTTLISSSTGSLVSFVGTLTVFVTLPAEQAVVQNAANVITGYPITVADNVFTLQDNLDPTKQAQFQLSGLTTETTFTYTLSNGSGVIPILNGTQTWNAPNTFSSSIINVGSATIASTQQFAYGATTTGLTKTVNVGTGGLSGSTTAITVGSANGSTTTMLGSTVLGGVAGNQSLQVNNVASAVNYAQIVGAVAGGSPIYSAQGTDTNINAAIAAKGTGSVQLQSSGVTVLNVSSSGTGVGDFINIYPTSGFMNWVLAGPDTNIGYVLTTKGALGFYFSTGGGQQAAISHTASAVNYLNLTGAATGAAPTLSAQGSDTNINLRLTPKGTGYTYLGNIVNIGADYSVNGILSLAGNTNVISGVGVQGVYASMFIDSTKTGGANMFSTYPNTQAAAFTIASLGHYKAAFGGLGAGSAITNQYGFQTDNSLIGATNNYGFYGNIAAATGRYNFYANGTALNVFVGNTTLGGAIGTQSFQVNNVSSAVNYIQAVGAITTSAPEFSAQGSDTNINLRLTPKGTGVLQFGTYTATVLSPTGFITITDAGGTSRRLLVG